MQQKMPWDEDWTSSAAPVSRGGFPTITTARDPLDYRRENRADRSDARAADAADRAAAAAERAADNDRRRLANEDRSFGNSQFDNLSALRKEFTGRKEVADYQTILPMVASAMKIARNPKATGADDLNLIYTFGKVMDPGSVVREGELALASRTGSFAQTIEGAIAKLKSGERLPEEVRHNLVDSMRQRGVELARSYNLSRRDYQQRARRFGFDPIDVVGDHPAKPFQQEEADFTGQAIGNFDGSIGARPGGIATGATRTEYDPKVSGVIDALVRRGASAQEINAAIQPLGAAPVDQAAVVAAQRHFRVNPNYKGSYGEATRELPTTAWQRFSGSPVGTGVYAAVDAGMAGLTDEFASALGGGDLDTLNERKQAAFDANPKAAFAGQVAGTIGSMAGLGALGRTAGIATRIPKAALLGDLGFGSLSGAGQANDNRILGGTLGAAGGIAGNVAGNAAASGIGAISRSEPVRSMLNRGRGLFGAPLLSDAKPLAGADRIAFGAINKAGPDNITTALTEARDLGVPFSLADTNPNIRELAGAAVRRSPTASTFAEGALLPRARGQFDRFTSSVESNLGPITNIPQRSADLTAQARAASTDLYGRAYANPVPSTPEMDTVLGTPFGRQALGRARTIAANERRSPDELGFALDDAGNVVLNPRPNDLIARHLDARAQLDQAQELYRAARQDPAVDANSARGRVIAARDRLRSAEQALNAAPDPSTAASVPGYTTQTLDYVKRGMDDVLEERRNPITGRLVLDEAGRAQNGVRAQLLDEVDRLNPDFAAARSAYAGPVASRDALARGGDAYSLHPDELGVQVANQSPEHLGQMQLGYRGALVDHAARIRDNANPWDATLGSPVARQRLGTIYPDNPGVDRLLRQQELEGQMAQTTNAILGNSRTARNQIADQTFLDSPLAQAAADVGSSAMTGGVPVATMMRAAAGRGIKDAARLGIGKRAAARADQLAPVLVNPNPQEALDTALDYLARERAWQELVNRTTPRRTLGMFGRSMGSQAAVAPLNR